MDSSKNNSGAGASGLSQELQKDDSMELKRDASSYVEYELICNMTTFLEDNGGEDVDKRTLRTMAEALTKHFNDSSPGTLQDVTMENPYGIGYRSPCVSLQPYQGSTSPAGQGRSVREFEEQMANLRKENFNLKLRLYFIEESIPGYKQANNSSSEDTLMKQIIDSKVEMEILRKELQEKQNLLKEAAQAMNQMENIQKETELKYQNIVDELNQKLQYFEMERDLEKSRTSGVVNELMDRSELHENLNALQKIRELEDLLKESEEKLMDYQKQLQGLSGLLAKRDEAIKEYEEKVNELVFQNAEYIETIEIKDKEIANNERCIRGLRSKNNELKVENEKLMSAFKHTQDNFSKEMSNVKLYEKQMREQQDVLTRMQSTISIKTENTARLLERIQDYEKMVTKMNIERNIVKRENRFFRTIINKLQMNGTATNKECFTFAKEVYHQYENAGNVEMCRNCKKYMPSRYAKGEKLKKDFCSQQSQSTIPTEQQPSGGGSILSNGGIGVGAYKLKQKFCVNICNNASCNNHMQKTCDACASTARKGGNYKVDVPAALVEGGDCLHKSDFNLNLNRNYEPELPIRYTFSDNSSLFSTDDWSSSTINNLVPTPKSSENSLTPTFSSSLICCHKDVVSSCTTLGELELRDFCLKAHKLREELQKLKAEMADKTCIAQDLEEKLKSRDELYDKARLTIQKLMVTIKNQQIENSRLKNSTQISCVSNTTATDKELTSGVGTSSSTLECTGFCRSFSDTEALNDLTCLQKQKYDNIIEHQEATIKNLKVEVKKKTADLQNLVNKELWEKNREIERLNKILNKSAVLSPSKSPLAAHNSSQNDNTTTTGELQQSFSELEYNKALQRNKLLQRKVDILIQRLSTERQNDSLIAQLKTELKQARLDAETADKWRRQCADLCAILSTRLEELAGFLNSLLKHKDVLGVLALDKRKAMRRAVDRSLDLSKSLNMTLSVSGLSMLDQSLAELTNLSDILGEVEIDLADNKTFNSHEELHGGQGQSSQSIEVLKAENKALKKELDKRRCLDAKKERRSLPLPTIITENRESESEAWSEPDRKVSLARIGLEDPTASLTAKDQTLMLKNNNETDSDYSDSNSRSFKARTQERILHLEQQIQQRDNRIMEIQYQLVDAEKRLKQENLKLLEVTRELQQAQQLNEELHQDLVAIGSQDISSGHNESNLLKQIEEKSHSLEKLQEERERLLVESKLAEMQFNAMKSDMEANKQAYEAALQKAAEKEKHQLALLKQELDEVLEKALLDKEQKHLECLQRDYVTKQEYEECCQQLSDLQKHYIEAQRSIECLQENEHELKQTLVETELSARNLQKQIDESTLRASKAAMERVKALNEKMQLVTQVDELTLQLDKYNEERLHLQQQIKQLEQEKQTFIERITLLQTKQQQQHRTIKSDDNQSGYTSEEVAMPLSSATMSQPQNMVAQQRLGEQRTQNSSPDLGIESDAGRVSSVELNTVQHPLLKTVEMSPLSKLNSSSSNTNVKEEALNDSCSENIKPSNVLEDTNNTSNPQGLSKKHDCLKVEQENAELRRKLLRTKRAFEDTYEKLRNANQRKAQIEKDIKNQILKTHNVLKNVRSNMENEL